MYYLFPVPCSLTPVPFISPKFGDIEALIEQKDLFDSNGFVHPRDNAPSWNPEYKIFCDYEYFLQCLDNWSADSFQILPTVLVNYVQTSEGIIGQSKYSEWVAELKGIAKGDQYKVLDANLKSSLDRLSEKYKRLSSKCDTIQAFVGQ